jgi:hypothetical protein
MPQDNTSSSPKTRLGQIKKSLAECNAQMTPERRRQIKEALARASTPEMLRQAKEALARASTPELLRQAKEALKAFDINAPVSAEEATAHATITVGEIPAGPSKSDDRADGLVNIASVEVGRDEVGPPKPAEMMLYFFLPRNHREDLVGDLSQDYNEFAPKFGRRLANLMYCCRVAKEIAAVLGLRLWMLGALLVWVISWIFNGLEQ